MSHAYKTVKYIAILLLCFVLPLNKASAQTTELKTTSRFILEDETQTYNLGSHLYTTYAKDIPLNADRNPISVLQKHKAGSKGIQNKGDIVAFPSDAEKSYFSFSLTNKTRSENWQISFGNVLQGRSGFVKNITLYSDTGLRIPIDKNNTINLQLGTNITAHFVLEVEKSSTYVLKFKPMLTGLQKENKNFSPEKIITSDYLYINIIAIFFGLFAGFFFLQSSSTHLYTGLYFLCNLIGFSLLDQIFIIENAYIINAIETFWPLSLVCFVLALRKFLRIEQQHNLENALILISLLILVLDIALLYLIPNEQSFAKSMGVLAPCITVYLMMAVLCFSRGVENFKLRFLLFFSVSIMLLTTLSYFVLPLTPYNQTDLLAGSYWYGILATAILFILVARQATRISQTEDWKSQVSDIEDIKSFERLKKTKEATDQERLIKIIEHERELMAQLREREMKRAEDMRKAKEEADRANQQKSAFLAVMSHEIRTPMNGVMGTIRLLQDTKLTKEQGDLVGTVQDSGNTMLRFLNDILDFEKIQQGHIQLEIIPFKLSKLVGDIMTLMKGHAAEKNIELITEIDNKIPDDLMGDPTRIKQVFLNLINNAIKFTHEGHVVLKIELQEINKEKGCVIAFNIIDSGIGIAPHEQKYLFDPFVQASEKVTRQYGGTGLGLAICQKLVDAMGGSLRVKSEKDKGSTFYFNLTLKKAGEIPEEAEIIEKIVNLPPLEILIIEDNKTNRMLLQTFLEKRGHKITTSETGKGGMDLCNKYPFDIILLDIHLGDMNGIEFAQFIRRHANKTVANIPIIAISGDVMKENQQKFFAAGVTAIVHKPINHEILLKTLASIFEEKQKETKNQEEQSESANAPIIDKIKTVTPKPNRPPESLSLDEDKKDNSYPDNQNQYVDVAMLETWKKSISADKIEELIKNCMEQLDDIVKELRNLHPNDTTMEQYRHKAHELTGMAGNFGLVYIAEIASRIEKAAKADERDKVHQGIKELPDATKKTNAIIDEWLAAF